MTKKSMGTSRRCCGRSIDLVTWWRISCLKALLCACTNISDVFVSETFKALMNSTAPLDFCGQPSAQIHIRTYVPP